MKILLTITLLFFLSACDSNKNHEPPNKPGSVSESAFWVGGADGGAYIEINKKSTHEYYAKIYFDATGEIWYEGVLNYSGDDEIDVNNKKVFSFWDGDTLYLVNNKQLTTEKK